MRRDDRNAVLAVLGVIALFVIFVYLGDKFGWIAHHREIPVWIGGDCLIGEIRDCQMETTTPPVQGMTYSREYLQNLPRMFCGSTPEGVANFYQSLPESERSGDAFDQAFKRRSHLMKVTYFGGLNRPEKFRLDWRCTRVIDSIECKAAN